ncbi:MAG: hypothetical protein IPI00_17105 [Flavobacteriales bacterium]|nr:hypothetical protein [Flavobacteriales bacterium]MBK6945734.1 hypothetical protein [Flavobacteriales bacterium]MBK7241832.1 hypothetical protein [Flavobacteriales bacterium]MBK9534717.1 hypothetical protein [Flavobacteriales bacterium]MBP9139904.1 hypothetical protein [Flavobacteriales bacterium]
MKKLTLAFLLFSTAAHAQNVGINATGAAPAASAMLDITSGTTGLLVPRVVLTSIVVAAPIVAPDNSLLVFNTNTVAGVNGVSPGYYYWNTPTLRWIRFAASTDAWAILGNAGTVAATNFLGTTDNIGVQVRTNNIQRYEFNTAGQLASFGDGTAALPAYSWTTNTNMGLFRQSLNTLGFSTTGVERMRISNIGNVGIGGVPGVGAILDLQATNKGALLPRVALTSIISNAPIGAAGILQAMMVYNTATAGAAPNNVYPGYYYWDGARWRRFVDATVGVWYYPPLNIAANTIYTLTAIIPGHTWNSGASVVLGGDWAVPPNVVVESVESRTGQVRFRVYNYDLFTSYLNMDFIITTTR